MHYIYAERFALLVKINLDVDMYLSIEINV